MSALAKKRWTAEEYLAFDRSSPERYELVNGEIFMMTGASENHNLIVANTITALNLQLRGRPCKLYPSDMRVQITATRDYHYPDVTVVCGDSEFAGDKRDTLLNPTLIIEVLSPTTEQYDRGDKFRNYRTLNSLQEYIMISQDTYRIERYLRQENDQWLLSDWAGTETMLELPSVGCKLALAEVYDKVTFETEEG